MKLNKKGIPLDWKIMEYLKRQEFFKEFLHITLKTMNDLDLSKHPNKGCLGGEYLWKISKIKNNSKI